jgi:hypothetical protein
MTQSRLTNGLPLFASLLSAWQAAASAQPRCRVKWLGALAR